MKKLILFALCIQAISCSIKDDNKMAVISGVWERGGTKTVTLYQVVSGRLDTLSTYNLKEDKSFGFAFNVEKEGFYVIGAGFSTTQLDKYTFYFKPGDFLSVEVNDSTYVLTGKNTKENEALTDWQQYIHPLYFKALYFFKTNSNYKDFFPQLEEQLNNPFVAKSTKNPVFDNLFAQYRTVNLINVALHFISTPRLIHPTIEDYPDFYHNIDLAELTKDDYLLYYPFGSFLQSNIVSHIYRLQDIDPRSISMEEKLNLIENDTLKGEFLLNEARYIRSYLGYSELMDNFGQYIILPDQQKRSTEIASSLANNETKPGQPAINFSGTDIKGKKISLSDFKGKMVMVDVWATWCGPCIQESPFFEKLITDYKGKDIVFMGVSVDVAKDKAKWEKFVKDNELHGVQLFAGNGWESDIAKFYQINSIPRFLLFDKKGNIVSINAPRPSSSEIRTLINKGLSE